VKAKKHEKKLICTANEACARVSLILFMQQGGDGETVGWKGEGRTGKGKLWDGKRNVIERYRNKCRKKEDMDID